ncbi:metalloregulator ArsR/SmtB family transcription factor [Corynebacterium callunae]|uniref:ArsR/SmtB family transcription factor n=1 Tax=Corynebacterium callunae TaxID=1721 RepID=UPI0039824E23
MADEQELMDLAQHWAPLFKLMGDRTRLSLLLAMHHRGPGEATVSELAQLVEVSLPTASAALVNLAENNIVEASKEGRVTRYHLVDEATHKLLHHLGGTHAHS